MLSSSVEAAGVSYDDDKKSLLRRLGRRRRLDFNASMTASVKQDKSVLIQFEKVCCYIPLREITGITVTGLIMTLYDIYLGIVFVSFSMLIIRYLTS